MRVQRIRVVDLGVALSICAGVMGLFAAALLVPLVANAKVITACGKDDPSAMILTEKAAITAAKAAWASIFSKVWWREVYSEQSIARFEPYSAVLENGVWQVTGTRPEGYQGYVPDAGVCRSNGSVSASATEN